MRKQIAVACTAILRKVFLCVCETRISSRTLITRSFTFYTKTDLYFRRYYWENTFFLISSRRLTCVFGEPFPFVRSKRENKGRMNNGTYIGIHLYIYFVRSGRAVVNYSRRCYVPVLRNYRNIGRRFFFVSIFLLIGLVCEIFVALTLLHVYAPKCRSSFYIMLLYVHARFRVFHYLFVSLLDCKNIVLEVLKVERI